jgi:DegV family protein with EDD domain
VSAAVSADPERLDRANTAIVVDSTADLSPQLLGDPNVTMVPLKIHFGDEALRDWVDIRPAEFYRRLREAPRLPTTSQPSVGAFITEYRRLRADFPVVYSVHISGRLSGTVASAELAASEVDGVRVFDTRSACVGVGLLLDRILAMLDRGTTAAEVEGLIERFHRDCGFLFIVDTLEYLQKGGRIGRASSLAGGLLSIKPLLTLTDGEVDVFAKVRGERKALAAVIDYFLARTRPDVPVAVVVGDANAPEKTQTLVELLRATDRSIDLRFTGEVGAVIGTYTGPGTCAVVFIEE